MSAAERNKTNFQATALQGLITKMQSGIPFLLRFCEAETHLS